MDLSFQMSRDGRGNSEENNDSDSEHESRVPTPRHIKFYTRSPPDCNNPLAHSSQFGHAPPVNLWYPRGQPAEDNRQVYYDRYVPESCSQRNYPVFQPYSLV